MKRIAALLMSILLIFSCVSAQETNEQKTFTLAGLDTTEYRSWKDSVFFTRMESKTGIRFDLQQYSKEADWTKAKASMTKSNAPDVLFKAALSSTECIDMYEKGILVDLLPYLERCCPNLWALLQENPEYMQAITLPSGAVVALPYITTTPMQNYMWINQAWLDKLNLKAPTNADEFVNVLTAFRDRDPNRNGKSDEIPFGFLGSFDLKFLAHAFGMIANDYNVYVADGQVRFMPLDDDFRTFVTWCRDLYENKLLDHNGFTTNSAMRQVTDSKAAETYGMVLAPVAADIFRVSWSTDYGILMPLSYNGKQIYRDFAGKVLRGTFAVTSACKDIESVLGWVDYLYSEEGSILASIGVENEDFVIDGDGTWRLTESASSNQYFTITNLIDGGGTAPGILCDAFQRRYSESKSMLTALEQQDACNAICVRPFPYYYLTDEQLNEISPLQNKIGYYVDMQIARWVLGEQEISDDSFNAFEEELKNLGIESFMTFWQNVLNTLSY